MGIAYDGQGRELSFVLVEVKVRRVGSRSRRARVMDVKGFDRERRSCFSWWSRCLGYRLLTALRNSSAKPSRRPQ